MNQTTPEPILLDCLHNIAKQIFYTSCADDLHAVIVLRGSVLMRRWFGQRARPAADIDLECFYDSNPQEQWTDIGPERTFQTLVDYGKTMCRYAIRDVRGPVEYSPVVCPEDGTDLWVYGTPGVRYYTGWRWVSERTEGILQIDIAEPGSYALSDIGQSPLLFDSPFVTPTTDCEQLGWDSSLKETFSLQGYTQEMLLAAKLSWLVRGFTFCDTGQISHWSGEPKDLFDVHLLLTAGKLNKTRFLRCMNVVCLDDNLDWNKLRLFAQIAQKHPNDTAPNLFTHWSKFSKQHQTRLEDGPWTLTRRSAKLLKPLLT